MDEQQNEFKVKVKPSEIALLRQAVINYNAQNYYTLQIESFEVCKAMYHVNISFKSVLYLLYYEINFIMFDFAKVYRDTEVDAY
jgi:hypothetical protein